MMAKIVKIERLFDDLGRKFFSDAQLQSDSSWIAQGWERRFTADEQRAKEAVELYTHLGYEVRAVPTAPEELQDDCQDCNNVVLLHFRTIYTRKKTE
jgi:hypothetical protein